MPGTRKSTGWSVPVGSTCTAEKNSRNTTGMPKVRKTVSPLVKIMVTSARNWATSGRISANPGTGGRGSPARLGRREPLAPLGRPPPASR